MSDLIRKTIPGGDHVTVWLGAYLDGELASGLREQIETHLGACPACQAELESLDQLSTLLQTSPAPKGTSEDDAFVRRVVEQVRRPAEPAWQRIFRQGWRFAPLALFAAWCFFQAVSLVSGLAFVGMDLIPGAREAFEGLTFFTGIPDSTLLGDLLRLGVGIPFVEDAAGQLGWLEPAGAWIILDLTVLGVLAVLFLGWFASWWAIHHSQA